MLAAGRPRCASVRGDDRRALALRVVSRSVVAFGAKHAMADRCGRDVDLFAKLLRQLLPLARQGLAVS